MLRINDKGGRIVMHVHDEVIIETADPSDLAMMQAVMAEPISWAPGLPLKAEGYTTYYYKKD
jgi:DNA polymerase